ncbi:hypothetical protein Tco_0435006 [Tanacetum coccineum]
MRLDISVLLDLDLGRGWDLATKLISERGSLCRGRLSAADALRHPYFLLGGDASVLSKLSFSKVDGEKHLNHLKSQDSMIYLKYQKLWDTMATICNFFDCDKKLLLTSSVKKLLPRKHGNAVGMLYDVSETRRNGETQGNAGQASPREGETFLQLWSISSIKDGHLLGLRG